MECLCLHVCKRRGNRRSQLCIVVLRIERSREPLRRCQAIGVCTPGLRTAIRTRSRGPIRGVKIARLDGRGHISNENAQDSSGIFHSDVSVYLEVGFAAVANQDEFALWKVVYDFLQTGFLPLRNRLKDTLQHARVLLEMEGAFGEMRHFEVGGEHWI